ncbi:transcriptional regulator [Cryobacterium adonitolivorans]|uniref:Transcriptional regulator n=1 Tax=Cryobacterium adonitolivorans TaxID=1259189 RepID=A0A4R8W8H6_9MICO|nr:transcriptional regulator [Cryobacterium adonitolivorans]
MGSVAPLIAARIRIILALCDGELSVNSLAELLEKSPPSVSQHLAKLRLSQRADRGDNCGQLGARTGLVHRRGKRSR